MKASSEALVAAINGPAAVSSVGRPQLMIAEPRLISA